MSPKPAKVRYPGSEVGTRKPYRAPSLAKIAKLPDVTALDSKVSGIGDT